jgi:hypothetical protein
VGLIQVAQHEVRVREGRLLVAEAVADRAGHRPRALRADPQAAAGVHPDQAAATRAHLRDVQRRHPQGVAAALEHPTADADPRPDLVLRHLERAPVLDNRGLGGGAAHVHRNQVRGAALRGEAHGRHHAAGRPGLDDLDGPAPGGAGPDHAAVGLHHQQRRPDTGS